MVSDESYWIVPTKVAARVLEGGRGPKLGYSYITLASCLQWVIFPIMGRKWIQSQVGVGGQMVRNGGAPKMRILALNTVSGTCTVAETVQESLWNLNLPLSHC